MGGTIAGDLPQAKPVFRLDVTRLRRMFWHMTFEDRYGGGRALVLGGSGGIGGALVDRLNRCMAVETLSRSHNGFDLTVEQSVENWASKLTPGYSVIFDATGALEIDGAGPEKSIGQIEPDAMTAQFALNAIGPALALKHLTPLLVKEGPCLFASLSARVGSIGDNRLGGWISYRAAKAALNQIMHTSAIEIARKRPDAVVVSLHPGTVQSDLTAKYLGRHDAVTPPEAAENLVTVMGELTPEDTGGFFDWKGEVIPW
ncbi:SDR family NAD(P)-dependent oxidoreductase [Pontivivens insulae]|nr:SDR family NAD(P)-dependent oxidoreductase [Pontivivens insulae]